MNTFIDERVQTEQDFSNINIGNFFEYNGMLFYKCGFATSKTYNAVKIVQDYEEAVYQDELLEYFPTDIRVTLVDVDIHIKTHKEEM